MARKARQNSNIGVYAVVLRGRSDIFANHKNKELFFSIIEKQIGGCTLLAYAMGHKDIYLIVSEHKQKVSDFVRKIGASFAIKYNKANLQIGKVFHDRYLSEPLQNNQQVMSAIKNLHLLEKNNNLTDKLSFISSYINYFNNPLIDTSFVINNDYENNLEEMVEEKSEKIIKLDKFDDKQVSEYIYRKYNIKVTEIHKLNKNLLTTILTDVFKITKVSARQIGRITKVPLRFLWNLTKKSNKKTNEKV